MNFISPSSTCKNNEKRKKRLRDLFKVKLYTIRSETEKKREKEIEIAWLTEITIKYQNLTEPVYASS